MSMNGTMHVCTKEMIYLPGKVSMSSGRGATTHPGWAGPMSDDFWEKR